MSRHEALLGRIRDAALVAFLAYAAVANFLAFESYRVEDAFITFRYAANLAAGEGFAFNPGERVLGTSTPLWTLLLAGLGALGLDLVAGAGMLYALCLSLCGGLGARLLYRQGHPNAGAVFALAAAWGVGGSLRFFGMETAFYLALIFLALLAADRGRPWATGVLLGLVATTRYDGVLVAGVVLLWRWSRERRLPWREAAVTVGLLGVWLLFAQLYFGSPLPNTLDAKSGDVSLLGYLGATLGHHRLLYTPVQRFWEPRLHPAVLPLVTLLLAMPAILRTRRLLRRSERLGVLPAIAAALWLGYAAIGPPLAHSWYLTPAVYCLLAFCLAAWGDSAGRFRGPLAAIAVLAAVAFSFAAIPGGARREAHRLSVQPVYRSRIEAYDQLAAWMRDHDLAGATLFTHEPGYLTYLTRQPVIDGAGLVTEGLFFHGPKERRTPLRSVVETYRPELMILGSETGHPDPRLGAAYLPVYQAQPRKLLLLRRTVFERHFDRLYDSRTRKRFYHPGPAPTERHPFAVDFETLPVRGWNHTAGARHFVGRPLLDLRFRRRPVADRYLHTWSRDPTTTAILWSDPFRIDFDELAFRFAATHRHTTLAQLYVGGLLTLEVGAPAAPAAPLAMRQVVLPVHGFRGEVGVLRFVDVDRQGGFLAADRIESRRWQNPSVFDDFESGRYGDRWRRGFGTAPAATRVLTRRYGLALASGSHAASSLGITGTGALVSHPFRIERNRMSFIVHDFGGPESGVELAVDGRVVRRFQGGSRRGLAGVKWDLSPWRGRRAVLSVIDGDEDPERGIGIDTIVLFDRASASLRDPAVDPTAGAQQGAPNPRPGPQQKSQRAEHGAADQGEGGGAEENRQNALEPGQHQAEDPDAHQHPAEEKEQEPGGRRQRRQAGNPGPRQRMLQSVADRGVLGLVQFHTDVAIVIPGAIISQGGDEAGRRRSLAGYPCRRAAVGSQGSDRCRIGALRPTRTS